MRYDDKTIYLDQEMCLLSMTLFNIKQKHKSRKSKENFIILYLRNSEE